MVEPEFKPRVGCLNLKPGLFLLAKSLSPLIILKEKKWYMYRIPYLYFALYKIHIWRYIIFFYKYSERNQNLFDISVGFDHLSLSLLISIFPSHFLSPRDQVWPKELHSSPTPTNLIEQEFE